MKVGINSKTIRIVFDIKEIYDFKFEDGSTSRHLLGMISARSPMDYFKKYIETNNFKKITDVSNPLTWGVEGVDKFENINYVDVDKTVGTVEHDEDYDDGDEEDYEEEKYITPTRKISQETINSQNEINFKKLFGK